MAHVEDAAHRRRRCLGAQGRRLVLVVVRWRSGFCAGWPRETLAASACRCILPEDWRSAACMAARDPHQSIATLPTTTPRSRWDGRPRMGLLPPPRSAAIERGGPCCIGPAYSTAVGHRTGRGLGRAGCAPHERTHGGARSLPRHRFGGAAPPTCSAIARPH